MNSMSRIQFAILLGVAICLCSALGAAAQSTRTWVSGVGDDANPGSRTAPCKTFAGAISKTAANGEIDVLDPGGFGTLTITKGITLDGKGVQASILAAGIGCINVNAGAGVVTIRNLSLNAALGGTFGISISAASEVRLENCTIFGGLNDAVNFQPTSTNAVLYLINCHIHDFRGNGVYVKAGTVNIENSIIESCGAGVNAAGGTAKIKSSVITGSTGAGLQTSGTGVIQSDRNNTIFGNNPDGAPTGPLPLR
jgi:hypothetical protein